MARWKLAAPHYLNVEGNKWEYTETSRTTGKQIRVQLPVPMYLDPRDSADFTHKWGQPQRADAVTDIEGEIIVCRGRSEDARDISFFGDPTPDMIPIDDEAKEISAGFSELWRYKPEVDAPGNFSQSLVDAFRMDMSEAVSKPTKVEGLDTLVAAIAGLVESQKEVNKVIIRRA